MSESLLSNIGVKLTLNQLDNPLDAISLASQSNIKLTESYLQFDRAICEGNIADAIASADLISEQFNGIESVSYVGGLADILRSALSVGYNDSNHLLESLRKPGHSFYANNYLVTQKLLPKTGSYVVLESTGNKVNVALLDDMDVTASFSFDEASQNWHNFANEMLLENDGQKHTIHSDGRPDLRRARVESGMSQREMADAMGIGKSTLAKWELGHANPRHNMVQKAASVAGVSPESFFDDGSVTAYEGNLNSDSEESEKEEPVSQQHDDDENTNA